MARVAVELGDMTTPEAKKMPPRVTVKNGIYQALIVDAKSGLTRSTPSLKKLTVEFQVIYEDGTKDESFKNRRVYQDYVLQPGDNEETNQLRRAQLVQLLDAAKVPYDSTGFDDDELKSKPVKITVRVRDGDQKDELTGKFKQFANVVMVDLAEAVDKNDLV